jgi:hypothetical protein
MTHLRRGRDLMHILVGDILEEGNEVNLLLVIPAQCRTPLLAHNRHHRLVVELGIVKAIEEVDCTGARGGKTNPEVAGELSMATGHKRGHLLVAHLDELQPALGPPDGAHNAIDTVAGVSINPRNTPLQQPLYEKITDRTVH